MAIFSPVQDSPGSLELFEEEEVGFLSVVSPKKKFMEREDEESAAADDGAETEEDTAAVATLLLCAAGANAEADAPNASRQRALRVIMFGLLDLALCIPDVCGEQ